MTQHGPLLQRAIDLAGKTGMPWTQAEEQALSELGINDAELTEIIGNHSGVLVGFVPESDVQQFVRGILVHEAERIAALAHGVRTAMADLHAIRQTIIAQLDRCTALAYVSGSHFAQHNKHAPSSIMAQADADAKLFHLIEAYAQAHVSGVPERVVDADEHCDCGRHGESAYCDGACNDCPPADQPKGGA